MPLEFTRVSHQNPCPICGKPDFCEIGDRAVLCQRVESEHPNKNKAGGWFHHFGTNNALKPALRRESARYIAPLKEPETILLRWVKECNQMPVRCLAGNLGISEPQLHELDCIYNGLVFCFPMRDDTGKIIGIRTRNNEGQKKAITGSRSGLFYSESPEALELLDENNIAFICEGPTNSAALLSMRLFPIGKPNCASGDQFVIGLLKRLNIRKAVVIADNDELKHGRRAGYIGADKLKSQLHVPSCQWVPPSPYKDIRDFYKAGGTREMILSNLKTKAWTR